MESTELLVVLSTFPDASSAARVGRVLVDEGLVACAQIEVSAIRSLYRWKGEVQDEPEVAFRAKTSPELRGRLIDRLTGLHPYDVPQIVFIEATANARYLAWLREQCDVDDPKQG